MHLLDYIVLAVILIWIIAAIRYIIGQRKAGRGSCGGCSASVCAGASCAVCPHRCPKAGVKLK